MSTSNLSSGMDFGTGLNPVELVAQLMKAERAPQTALKSRRDLHTKEADAYKSLMELVRGVTTAANAIDLSSEWQPLRGGSTSDAVKVSTTTGGIAGALSFKVLGLAKSHTMYSAASVASPDTTVTSASSLLLGNAQSLGLTGMTAIGALAEGEHTLTVTQSSAAAVQTGTVTAGANITFGGGTANRRLTIDGVQVQFNSATYTQSQVVSTINTALSGAGSDVRASFVNNQLELRTTREGSAATVALTSVGSEITTRLGLTNGTTTGTDAKVTLDGVETTVTSVVTGGTVSLASSAGSISATIAGAGLRAGTTKLDHVDIADGKLSTVVEAINKSDAADFKAVAVKVGTDQYKLQLQSKTSGAAGQFALDASVFDQLAGGFSVLTTGADAEIEIAGDNPYTIKSSTNSFADVMPGVSLELTKPTSDTVTVTVSRDRDALADRVNALVTAINKVVNDVAAKTRYEPDTNSGAILAGQQTARRVSNALRNALTDAVSSAGTKTAAAAGITLAKDGTVTFDKAKFLEAYDKDPVGVQRLFETDDAASTDPGIAKRIQNAVELATKDEKGYLALAESGARGKADRIKTRVDDMEDRLLLREVMLRMKFTNLNVAVSGMKNAGKWLAGSLGYQ